MAIQDILNALDEQAHADCEQVIAEAHAHAEMILDEASRAASTIHEHFAQQVERVARAEAAKTVNSARLEAKKRISSTRGESVAAVIESARSRLAELRDGDYDRLFDALASEALAESAGEIVVHVSPEDVDRARRALEEHGLQGTVSGDLETAGGLSVESYGGRVIRRNTLEDRLDRVAERVQADVARAMFS